MSWINRNGEYAHLSAWQVLSFQLPIWVSRKTNDGMVSTASVPLWLFMLIFLLLLLNVLLWGGYGIYEWFRVVV